MANLLGTLEVRVQDDNGLVNPLTFYIQVADTATLAQVQGVVSSLLLLVDDVMDGKPVKATVTMDYAVTGVKSDPVAECNNQEGGLIVYEVAGTKYSHSVFFPSFMDSLSVQGLIENSGATQTMNTYILGGPYNGLTFTDRYGNALSGFKQGRTTFRKFRRQLARAASGGHTA